MLLILFVSLVFAQQSATDLVYPKSEKMNQSDNYFGVLVPDPYRWLEETNTAPTREWIDKQIQFTKTYLSKIPFREGINKRLTDIWNYEKHDKAEKVGEYYFYYKNDGLQEHYVVYYQRGLDAKPKVFLDPNQFSKDGSISLKDLFFSNDDKYCAYTTSESGSDWRELHVIKIDTRTKLNDHLQWIKFSYVGWYHDGFFYSRYDQPEESEKLKEKNEYHKIYYHKLGTLQSDDVLVYEDKNNPERLFYAQTSADERYLVITVNDGSSKYPLLYYKDLKNDIDLLPLIETFAVYYHFIENTGEDFLIRTNYDAPNYQVIKINPEKKEKKDWRTIIPESKHMLYNVYLVGGKILTSYLHDATAVLSVFDLQGIKLYDLDLPGLGRVQRIMGRIDENEVFYAYTSYTTPLEIYRYNIDKNKSEIFKKPAIKVDLAPYKTQLKFYTSKDGTKIPLFITHKKGLNLNGENPVLLYGYGGFNIPMRPYFSVARFPLLENGFVYAVACLRGGNEYGENWHKAGMLDKKQNVFDDFIAAAEFLIKEKYTNPKKLAIMGASNGGLLVGACINQRPGLFAVAFPDVGVMDMLRFHKFTIGWAWVSEYGSSEDSSQFQYLYQYSPLHNIQSDLDYPATLITTADHDDRVFPAHSYKYAATMQEKYRGGNPILLRIETKTGHGAAKTTSTIIRYADSWAFLLYQMGIKPGMGSSR